MPRVVVTMPTRNRANLIGRAIRSLGRQTFRDFELLVGDDGCTDGTPEAVEREAKAAGVAFRIINGGGEHIGLPSMRNRLIRESDSEFVAVLDDDDETFPDRLEVGVRMMEGDPRMAVAGGAAVLRNKKPGHDWVWRTPTKDMDIRRLSLKAVVFSHSTTMMRRSHLPSQEPYDETMKRAHDALLWAQMTKREDITFANVHEPTAIMHFHRQQADRAVILAGDKEIHKRRVELNAEFLETHGAPRDMEVAGWLATEKWWTVEPGSVPAPDRVQAAYGGLDRWGLRVVGEDLAHAMEYKKPWLGKLDLRGPVSLKRRVLVLRALKVASGIRRRLSPRRNRAARKPRGETRAG